MKKVLIINSHLAYPEFSEGRLTKTLVSEAKFFFEEKGITVLETVIADGYNPEEEVDKHAQADLIILQMPVNWFGMSWICKKYMDEVFNTGAATGKLIIDDGRTRNDPKKQYGTGGKMQGKRFMISATWNAPQITFDNADQILLEGKGTSDVFLGITSIYKFCGATILKDFNCFDVIKNPEVEKYLESYKQRLSEIL